MDRAMKILLLEDLEEDAELIQRTLKKQGLNHEARRVDTREEFSGALDDFKPDVILSDHALPLFNSLEALNICKHKHTDAPFILVTGAVSEEFAVNCLKQGADDYVLKSNLVRLPSAIQNAIRQREHEMKRKSAELALRNQNEELLKINRELDSFVYSVSHNLRAPLMSVLGLIQLVQNENQTNGEALARYFGMMEQSVHKLDETLKEILEYSRNARSELTTGPMSFRQLVHDAFERMKYMKGSESIEKMIEIEEDQPFYSDGYRVSVVINNLISNAIKYSDPRKPQRFIRIKGKVDDQGLTMRIEDNGIGIGPDYINKIFNMFFRATERSEGAGLGLYIVREAVDKLRGRIQVESEPGAGTVFTLSLPDLRNKIEQNRNVLAAHP